MIFRSVGSAATLCRVNRLIGPLLFSWATLSIGCAVGGGDEVDSGTGVQMDAGPGRDAGGVLDAALPMIDGGGGSDAEIPPVGDAGPMGFDAGPTGFDAGPMGFDSGPMGFDAGPPRIDAGPPGFDAGPPGVDAGPGGSCGLLPLMECCPDGTCSSLFGLTCVLGFCVPE